MTCAKCHREVHETMHTINSVHVDYYGRFITKSIAVGKSMDGKSELFKGWVEPEEITCVQCYMV